MAKEFMDVVIILDKSGSMVDLTDDTIGGYNSLIEQQKKENKDKDIYVSTYLFNTQVDTLCFAQPISKVEPLTREKYVACGGTALFDAIGDAVNQEDARIVKLARKGMKIPQKTLIVVTTDGYENSSKKYTNIELIRKLIQQKKDEGVCFMFIGADIDSDSFAEKIGIGADYAFSVERSSNGVRDMMNTVSCCMVTHPYDVEDNIREMSKSRRTANVKKQNNH